jgi:L-fuculose-phosphate aldolase
MNLQEIKAQIVDCSHRLWKKGYVANHDGNISYKISQNLFIATPTSFSKIDINEEDLLIVDHQGQVKEGKHKVFSEFALHLSIYKTRSDVQAIVHGHPPAATGIGLSGFEIGIPGLPEAIISLGRGILTTSFMPQSKIDTGELERVLKESDAFLIPGNGVWCVGQNILQTYLRLELVEQISLATIYAKNFGGVKPLPVELVEELLKKRPKVSSVTIGLEAPVINKNQLEESYQKVRQIVQEEVVKIWTQT